MPLSFPRKFTHGQKVNIADVYGELHIWPDGYFHYMISIRNTHPGDGCRVHVSFVLFDGSQTPLGAFGMPPEEELPISLWGRIHHDLYGKIPGAKLTRAESVALAFRTTGEKLDVFKLWLFAYSSG